MPVRGPEWDAVVVVSSQCNRQDLVECLYCKNQFVASATRIRKHIISSTSRGIGIGKCKGKPPQAFVDLLIKLDDEKTKQMQHNQKLKKLQINAELSLINPQPTKRSNQTKLSLSSSVKANADVMVARFFFQDDK